MQTWFNCVINYLKVDDDGRERKVSESYLVDAASYTDAEARITKQCSEMIRGEFRIKKITQTGIIEIFPNENNEQFYVGKVSIVTIDEKAGKEMRVINQFLVAADDLEGALKNLKAGLSYILVPYKITSISISNIVDVFPYFEDKTGQVPEGDELVNEIGATEKSE